MASGQTRRDHLKLLAAAAGVLVAPAGARAQPDIDKPSALPSLRVSVHQPGGDYLEKDAKVSVRPVRGGVVRLERRKPELVYSASIGKGRFRLHVEAEGFAPVDQTI